MDGEIEKILCAMIGLVYGYCIKRLTRIEDAQDLSQEILLELLKFLRSDSDVKDQGRYIWKIAHNRYARWLQKSGVNRCCGLEELPMIENGFDDVEESELRDAAFRAVAGLAQTHREIMVDYYVKGLSCEKIAVSRGLPVGTVRSRLHYGRNRLKERVKTMMNEGNKIYERIDWHIMCNGSMDPDRYLGRQTARAICTAAYSIK